MVKMAVLVFAIMAVSQASCRQVDVRDFENANQNTPSVTVAAGLTTTTTPSPALRNCMSRCPEYPQYNPVCGTDGVSYPNIYRMRCVQNCGVSVQVSHVGTCGQSAGGK